MFTHCYLLTSTLITDTSRHFILCTRFIDTFAIALLTFQSAKRFSQSLDNLHQPDTESADRTRSPSPAPSSGMESTSIKDSPIQLDVLVQENSIHEGTCHIFYQSNSQWVRPYSWKVVLISNVHST